MRAKDAGDGQLRKRKEKKDGEPVMVRPTAGGQFAPDTALSAAASGARIHDTRSH